MQNLGLAIPFVINPWTVAGGVAIGVATALIFGLLPIIQAATIRPLNVIRDLLENRGITSVILTIVLLILLSDPFLRTRDCDPQQRCQILGHRNSLWYICFPAGTQRVLQLDSLAGQQTTSTRTVEFQASCSGPGRCDRIGPAVPGAAGVRSCCSWLLRFWELSLCWHREPGRSVRSWPCATSVANAHARQQPCWPCSSVFSPSGWFWQSGKTYRPRLAVHFRRT